MTGTGPVGAADSPPAPEQLGERLGLPQLAGADVPPEVESWLARLALLYGVPFEHVVADETMLPRESIRFFYLDANWVEAMVDGAFSVGVHSQRDLRFHRVLHGSVREATEVAAGKLRRDLRGEAVSEEAVSEEEASSDSRVRAGFLMRSEIVSGWPGLEVTGYEGAEAGDAGADVPLLRLERLAPDLMLCLFDRVPDLVVVSEPREGLHFGLTDGQVTTRDLSDADGAREDADAARQTGRVDAVWRPHRSDLAGRVDLGATADVLANDGLVQRGLVGGGVFGPGDLAAQMISTAMKQHFDPAVGEGQP